MIYLVYKDYEIEEICISKEIALAYGIKYIGYNYGINDKTYKQVKYCLQRKWWNLLKHILECNGISIEPYYGEINTTMPELL